MKYRFDIADHEYGGSVIARTPRGKEVGFLETAMVSHDHVMMVTELDVDKNHRRRGLATRMYEIAASESCVRGRPLASGLSRSDAADTFWRKQEAKGRAQKRHAEGEDYYVLSCPPPTSLAAARRRRR